MKTVSTQVDRRKFLVGNFPAFWVLALVKFTSDSETMSSGRSGDEANDHRQAREGLPTPVDRDV